MRHGVPVSLWRKVLRRHRESIQVADAVGNAMMGWGEASRSWGGRPSGHQAPNSHGGAPGVEGKCPRLWGQTAQAKASGVEGNWMRLAVTLKTHLI